MLHTKKLTLSAFFLALGVVMPFFTGQIAGIGNMLLPMHIPVLLCGYICGWQYGMLVGMLTPLLRSVLAGMPVMLPTAVTMAFELAAYGIVVGLLYHILKEKVWGIYVSLIGAMLVGRLIWGTISVPVYGLAGKSFSWELFLTGAFTNALPGIVLQLVLVPILVIFLKKAGVIAEYEG